VKKIRSDNGTEF
jgi:hypothetical protein